MWVVEYVVSSVQKAGDPDLKIIKDIFLSASLSQKFCRLTLQCGPAEGDNSELYG